MLQELIVQFGTLAGVAALVAALVNVAKVFGLPDGSAPKLSAGLSLAAFAVLVGLKVFAPDVDVLALDAQAADFAVAALYILGFIVQMGLPSKVHSFLSTSLVPIIGKSHTIDKWDSNR